MSDKVEVIFNFVDMDSSGGNKRKLSVALVFMTNPTLIFLDEPTTVLLC